MAPLNGTISWAEIRAVGAQALDITPTYHIDIGCMCLGRTIPNHMFLIVEELLKRKFDNSIYRKIKKIWCY